MDELIHELESIRNIGIVNHKKDTATIQKAIDALKQFTWRNPSEPPETDKYVLLSYSNYSLPDIGEYREDGKYYPGDDERSCESFGLIVDGWMPMPKVRRELGAE